MPDSRYRDLPPEELETTSPPANWEAAAQALGLKSVLGVPMEVGDRLLGVAVISTLVDHHTFTPDEAEGVPGRTVDGDPLDICVLSERPINRAEVLLDARNVGGLLMIDNGVVHAEQVVLAALEDYSDMFGQESAR